MCNLTQFDDIPLKILRGLKLNKIKEDTRVLLRDIKRVNKAMGDFNDVIKELYGANLIHFDSYNIYQGNIQGDDTSYNIKKRYTLEGDVEEFCGNADIIRRVLIERIDKYRDDVNQFCDKLNGEINEAYESIKDFVLEERLIGDIPLKDEEGG